MSTYDDDGVIALLHDAVPPLPEVVPDRVAAVRHVARRQRARVWTQTLAVVVAVLAVAGVAAAVALHGTRTLQPVAHPLALAADAFSAQKSYRFEITVSPVGVTTGRDAERATGHLTGILANDTGDGVMAGTMPFMAPGNFELRRVDGTSYLRPGSGDPSLPPGKTWLRMTDPSRGKDYSPAEVKRYLRMAEAAVDETPFLGMSTVRGVPVARYRIVVNPRYTHDKQIDVVLAIDADGLPRRVDVETPYAGVFGPEIDSSGLRVHATIDLFGYGDRVNVTAPPSDQVMTEEDVTHVAGTESSSPVPNAFFECMQRANADNLITDAETARCRKLRPGSGGTTTTPVFATTISPTPVK